MANDAKLWKVFSEYIRLRDSDEQGDCKCFTCPAKGNWKGFDCGHGVGRQHKSTKFDERNNHAQCKRCNGFESGEQAIYKEEVEKRYGKVSVWSKNGEYKGLFNMDSEQLVEKFLEPPYQPK